MHVSRSYGVIGFVPGGTFGCNSVSACCGAIGVCGFDGRFTGARCIPFLRTCAGTLKGGRCCRRMLEMVALLSGYRLGTLILRGRG